MKRREWNGNENLEIGQEVPIQAPWDPDALIPLISGFTLLSEAWLLPFGVFMRYHGSLNQIFLFFFFT